MSTRSDWLVFLVREPEDKKEEVDPPNPPRFLRGKLKGGSRRQRQTHARSSLKPHYHWRWLFLWLKLHFARLHLLQLLRLLGQILVLVLVAMETLAAVAAAAAGYLPKWIRLKRIRIGASERWMDPIWPLQWTPQAISGRPSFCPSVWIFSRSSFLASTHPQALSWWFRSSCKWPANEMVKERIVLVC